MREMTIFRGLFVGENANGGSERAITVVDEDTSNNTGIKVYKPSLILQNLVTFFFQSSLTI